MKRVISGLIGVVFMLAALPALAGEVWTFPVTNKEPALAPPTDPDIKSIPGTYTALDPSKVTNKVAPLRKYAEYGGPLLRRRELRCGRGS